MTTANALIAESFVPQKTVVFSDGCAAQYKSSGPFADLSLKLNSVNRNYFGSEHGKGKGDGEIGVVNRALDRAICGQKVIITSAFDAYEWCRCTFELDDVLTKREFLYVPSEKIDRKRSYTNASTLKGTRRLHQMQNMQGPYQLMARKYSCFCDACINDTGPETCINNAVVGEMALKKLNPTCISSREAKTHEKAAAEDADTVALDDILNMEIVEKPDEMRVIILSVSNIFKVVEHLIFS